MFYHAVVIMDLHLSGSLIPRIWLLTDLEKKGKNITKVGVLDDPYNFGSILEASYCSC